MTTETTGLPSVTYEQLQGIFTSRNFIRGIKKASDVSLKVGFESQFTFWRGAKNNKIKYFPHTSTSCSLPDSTSFEITDKQSNFILDQKLIPLLFYHYHPMSDVTPSEPDLQSHINFREEYGHIQDKHAITYVTNHNLDCIGADREQGQFHDVLVYQNKSPGASLHSEGENVRYQIKQKLRGRIGDNISVAEAFDSLNNWNATLLTYERHGNIYTLPKEQLSRLEKFAYTPTIESVITHI